VAFPFLVAANFEQGTNAEWDSEADTGSLLDFPHYSTLAAIPGLPMPFRGAYCMRIRMGDTNDHTVTEGDIDIADAATGYFRFYLYAHTDVTATADDVFSIFELQQAGGTVECTMGMRITAATNALDIGIGDGTAPSSYVTFPRGRWVCVEWAVLVSTGGVGTSTLYIEGLSAVALTTQTHAAAIGTGVLGTQLTLATTSGTLLFDQFVMDDARIFPIVERFPSEVLLTKSGHVFVGNGRVENVSLLSGNGTDCVLSIFDTDSAYTSDAGNCKLELKNVTANDIVDPAGVPVNIIRGCYVQLAGTTPRAIVKIKRATGYSSDGAIRTVGFRRTPRPLNA